MTGIKISLIAAAAIATSVALCILAAPAMACEITCSKSPALPVGMSLEGVIKTIGCEADATNSVGKDGKTVRMEWRSDTGSRLMLDFHDGKLVSAFWFGGSSTF